MFSLVAIPAGGNTALKCAAAGNPIPEIDWFKDGKPVEKGGNVSIHL